MHGNLKFTNGESGTGNQLVFDSCDRTGYPASALFGTPFHDTATNLRSMKRDLHLQHAIGTVPLSQCNLVLFAYLDFIRYKMPSKH